MKNKLKTGLISLLAVPALFVSSYLMPKADADSTLERLARANTIYLLKSGNDIYDGSSPEFAVQTWDRAYELSQQPAFNKLFNNLNIGEGIFEAEYEGYYDFINPIEIRGKGWSGTILKGINISNFNHMKLKNIGIEGYSILENPAVKDMYANVLISENALIENTRFGKNSALILDSANWESDSFIISYGLIQNPSRVYADDGEGAGNLRCDWNGDWEVNALDAQIVINQALGYTNDSWRFADADENGVVDAIDVQETFNNIFEF